MDDILATGCDILTIGQYLQPIAKSTGRSTRYATPEDFARYKELALQEGLPPCGVRAARAQLLHVRGRRWRTRMIYIETGSTDVYYNFGLENYFTVEKRLPDTVFPLLAHDADADGRQIPERARRDQQAVCRRARHPSRAPYVRRRDDLHRSRRLAIHIHRAYDATSRSSFTQYIAPCAWMRVRELVRMRQFQRPQRSD